MKPSLQPLPPDLDTRFHDAGIAIVEYALAAGDLTRMEQAFPDLATGSGGARSAEFNAADLAWLARHGTLGALADRLGGVPMRLVRALALDKTPGANWFVPWHQDRSDEAGERPAALLARMVALRVHLDACGEDDGPLEVIAGSHRAGRLPREQIAELAADAEPLLCLTDRGDILAMRPLLVHRSQRARLPMSRRVLHLEYAPSIDLAG